jgi:hypothetical protein
VVETRGGKISACLLAGFINKGVVRKWAHPRQCECPLDEAGGNELHAPLVHLASLAHPALHLKADCVLRRWRGRRLRPRPDLCQPRLGFVSVAHTVLQQDHLPWQLSNALLHLVSVPLIKNFTINGDTRGWRSTTPRHHQSIAEDIRVGKQAYLGQEQQAIGSPVAKDAMV